VENIKLVEKMGKAKNIQLMKINYYLKENIYMVKRMEKELNIIIKAKRNLKVNI